MEDAQLEISDTPKSPSEMFGKLQELTNELRSEGGDVARTIALALLIYDLAKREKMLAIIRWIKEEFILENQKNNIPKEKQDLEWFALYKWKTKPEITIKFFKLGVLIEKSGRHIGSYSWTLLNEKVLKDFKRIIEQNDNGIPTREEGFQNRT